VRRARRFNKDKNNLDKKAAEMGSFIIPGSMIASRNSYRILPLLFAGLTLCQCAKEEEAPPVGVLKTTTHEFTLHAGTEGTLYTVRDGSGKVIAKEVSGAVLAAEFPKLSEDLKGLYAGNKILQSTMREPDPGTKWLDPSTIKTIELVPGSHDLPPIPDLSPRAK